MFIQMIFIIYNMEAKSNDIKLIVQKYNELSEKERINNMQFIEMTDEKQTKEVLDKINYSIENNSFEDMMINYASVVNQNYIKQQLLNFELENKYKYYNQEKMDLTDHLHVLNLLNKYKHPFIDDEWIVELNSKYTNFKNTFIQNYKHDVVEHLEKVLKMLDVIYTNTIDYDFDPAPDNCTRRVVRIMFKL